MSTKTLMSAEEFDRLEEPDELRYELDEGELIEMTKPRYDPHNRIVRRISRALDRYLDEHPIGDLLSADNLFVLGPNTKRAPDLSFMTNERLSKIELGKDVEGAPDLAIEVLSPSDSAVAIRRKVKQYFEAGARMVWIVFPESREIEVWRKNSGNLVLGESEMLSAEEILPGFAAKIGSLF